MTTSRYGNLVTGVTAKLPGDYKQQPAVARTTPDPQTNRMNGTETRYAEELEVLRCAGQIRDWRFEPFSLRLAKATYYKPDFVVILNDGRIRVVEVKGFWRDDARVKFKVAADLYWWFEFVAVTVIPKRDGGGWKEEHLRVSPPIEVRTAD